MLDQSQEAAIENSMSNRFSVINGGAGCGKTTIIKELADRLTAKGELVYLCAFAGKAAARLREATDYPASTIHSMLCYQGDGRFMLRDLLGKTVIIDEASMVSSDLLYEIVSRSPRRLVLVGDEAQLPPVGDGQPFHDIIRLCPRYVKTLTVCYRNTEAIYKAASAVRAGFRPSDHDETANEKWNVIKLRDATAVHEKMLALVASREYDPATDIILACRNGDGSDMPASVDSLNRNVKRLLNPKTDETYSKVFDPGDRVMCTKNTPDLDVWNGTTGVLREFDSGGAAWIDLDYRNSLGESSVMIPKSRLSSWELAYAITVHKSQGSQYRRVFFLCVSRDSVTLLSRSMFYTAITRAQQECCVLCDNGAIMSALRQTSDKSTVIQELVDDEVF